MHIINNLHIISLFYFVSSSLLFVTFGLLCRGCVVWLCSTLPTSLQTPDTYIIALLLLSSASNTCQSELADGCSWPRLPQVTPQNLNNLFIYFIFFCVNFRKDIDSMESYVLSTIIINNKFALLWGEAQLCLPYICL